MPKETMNKVNRTTIIKTLLIKLKLYYYSIAIIIIKINIIIKEKKGKKKTISLFLLHFFVVFFIFFLDYILKLKKNIYFSTILKKETKKNKEKFIIN